MDVPLKDSLFRTPTTTCEPFTIVRKYAIIPWVHDHPTNGFRKLRHVTNHFPFSIIKGRHLQSVFFIPFPTTKHSTPLQDTPCINYRILQSRFTKILIIMVCKIDTKTTAVVSGRVKKVCAKNNKKRTSSKKPVDLEFSALRSLIPGDSDKKSDYEVILEAIGYIQSLENKLKSRSHSDLLKAKYIATYRMKSED